MKLPSHCIFRKARSITGILLCLLIHATLFAQTTIQVGPAGPPPAAQGSFYDGDPSPVRSVESKGRIQVFYTQAELAALGMTGPQVIDSFSFYVYTLPAGSFQNYSAGMKSVSEDFIHYDCLNGFSPVYNTASYSATLGWNVFELQNPFYWNGVDNLVLNFCWTDVPAAPATGGLWIATGSNDLAIKYFYSNTIPACDMNVSQQDQYYDFRPVMRISYHAPAACSGTPVASIAPAGPVSVQAGCAARLEAGSNGLIAGLSYQWEVSTNSGTTWTPVTDAVSSVYEFYPSLSAQYRVTLTCGGNSATSGVTTVNVIKPVPATLPYFQDFESWADGCLDLKELPDVHWSTYPNRGESSWRRNDQGQWAGWKDTMYGGYAGGWAKSGNYAARFHSYAIEEDAGKMDLYLDCSTGGPDKALYFYYNDSTTNTMMLSSLLSSFLFNTEDSLMVLLSTDAGNSFSNIGTYTEWDGPGWKRVHIPFTSASPNTILRFYASRNAGSLGNFTDIAVDSLYVANACSGAPAAGIISDNSITSCSIATKTFSATGTTLAGGLNYQWQESADGVSWTNVTGGTGGNTLTYTTPNLTDTAYYRMIVKCTSSNQSDTTNIVSVFVQDPLYASLPFTEGFEEWSDYCDQHDRPSPYWLNNPATGDFSWRRDDEGATANWNRGTDADVYNYNYNFSWNTNYTSTTHTNPPAIEGTHFGRNHAGYAGFDAALWSFLGTGPYPSYGKMDLHLDCSAPGQKELSFFYNNQGTALAVPLDDSLVISLSTDGGTTFNNIWSEGDVNDLWNYVTVPVTSTSPNTIIRFTALSDFSDGTIGIDRIQVANACNGQPNAGIVDSATVNYSCANDPFYVRLLNTSQEGGLTYKWQTSPDGSTWTVVAGSNTPVLSTSISTDTWFRCIVKCTATNQTDATPARLIKIAPFYYCYCASAADNFTTSFMNIGNVLLRDSILQDTVLDNGIAGPVTDNPGPYHFYTDYRNVTAAPLAQGGTYQMKITFRNIANGILSSGANPAITGFIDFDGNGIYEPLDQVFFSQVPSLESMVPAGTPFVTDISIPANAHLGLTGMRIVFDAYDAAANAPCGYTSSGETEDYLVMIGGPDCSGAPQAGIAYITDTLVVTPGGTVIVYDTAHDNSNSHLFWIWQSSEDGINWTDIAGSEMQDSISASVTSITGFRLLIACGATHDTTYSNSVIAHTLSIRTLAEEEGDLHVYPNPTDGRFVLYYSGHPQRKMEMVIGDVTGKELIRKDYSDITNGFKTEIDLSKLARGLYIIRTDFENGSLINRIILK